jgi:hypothetical protein
VSAPSRATAAGRACLDLRTKARTGRRSVDESLQLYVLEPRHQTTCYSCQPSHQRSRTSPLVTRRMCT